MSFRTTTLLFGLLLAVLWTFGMVLAMRRSTLDQGFVSPQFAQDTESNVNSVEIAKDGKSLTFAKADDGAWFMTQTGYKQKVRVPTNKVTDLIREIQTARHSANTDVSRDLDLFKLNKPDVTVTLKTDKGKEIQFFVGKVSGDNLLAFCNSSERKKDVLAVTRSSISSIFLEPDKFRSNTLLDDKQPPTGVALKETDAQGKSTELALQKFKNKYWRFVQPRYGPADYEGGPSLKNDQSLSGLLATVTGLVAAEFEPFDSPVGIDPATAKLRIEVDFGGQEDPKDKDDKKAKSDSKKQILLIGGEVPGREKDKEMYYARLDHEGADKSVVRVGKKQLDAVFALMKKPEVMRSRDVAQFDPKLVDAVEIWRDGDFVIVYERKIEGQVNWLVFASDKAQRLGSDDAIEDEKTGWLAAIVGRQAIAEKDLEAIDKPERVKELDAMFADPAKVKATVKVFSDSILPEPKKETPKKDPKKDEPKKEGEKQDDPKKTDPKKEEPKYDAKKDTNPPRFKPDAKPVVTLSFIPIGEDNKVMVKREAPDNDPMYFKLTKAAYEKIVPPEMGLTFYDTGISPFTSTDAFKFELLRVAGKEKETFILQRELPKEKTDEEKKKEADTKAAEAKKAAEEKKNEPGDDKKGDPKEKKTDDKKEPNPNDWKLVEPKNFGKADVEQRDVDGLLRQLGDLRAERWVRQAGKDSLAQYGLDSPSIVATVSTKKKEGDKEETKTVVIKIGNKSRDDKDKNGYYAMQDGSDFVFVIRAGLEKQLEEAEFRDRLVLKFESKDIKEIKMWILNKEGNFTHDPVVERDGDKGWKMKSGFGANFIFDPQRVDEMVDKMSDFKCVRYLSAKTPPPADWKLEGKDVPYKIEFDMKDAKDAKEGKTKHWITIGARQKEDGPYYGMSSLRPDVVFLIPASAVETMMKGYVSWYSKN